MAKRDVLHELEEYLYPTLQNLAVGKILCTSRSDHSATHGQTIMEVTIINLKKMTVGRAGGQTTLGGGQNTLEQRLAV
jgi:hypothetical protein